MTTLRHRVSRLILALVSVASLAAAVGSPPPASLSAQVTTGSQGIVSGWVIDDQGRVDFPGSRVGLFSAMREAGAGWVRIELRLGPCFADWTSPGCDTAQGPNALSVYDLAIAEARAQGLLVLGLVDYLSWPGTQSQWTANNAEHNRTERYGVCRNEAGRYSGGCNGWIQRFADNAVAVLASHYDGVNGPLVDHWEIWNEPNAWTYSPAPGVYEGGYFLYPSNFAWILRLSHEAIKAAQPNAVVISGGLFAFDVDDRLNRSGAYTPPTTGPVTSAQSRCAAVLAAGQSGSRYLCAVYEMGRLRAGWRSGATPFDHIGQHLYVDQWKRTTRQAILAYLQELRYAYRDIEGQDTPKQIYITEVGWTTDTVSSVVQAENLQVAFEQAFRPTPFVARAFWFLFRDEPDAALRYGLIDGDGSRKPAFAAFQQSAAY